MSYSDLIKAGAARFVNSELGGQSVRYIPHGTGVGVQVSAWVDESSVESIGFDGSDQPYLDAVITVTKTEVPIVSVNEDKIETAIGFDGETVRVRVTKILDADDGHWRLGVVK